MKVSPTHYFKGKPIVEIDFREGEGWLLELARTTDSRLALIQYLGDGTNYEASQHFLMGDYVASPPNEDEFTRHVRFARKLATYESVGHLLQKVDAFLARCLDLDDQHRFILACFVLSSWVVDHLPLAPYVAFVGLPQSGKSTALKTLQLLCRRGMITSDISSAAFYHACDRLKPTLFIDETATAGQQRALFHLLRSGTTRDSVAFRDGESYCAFGAKAMAWRELPNDDALNSRCVVIPMRETSRTDLLRTTHPEIVAAADKLQGQLLLYRFQKCRTLSLPRIPGDDRLHSRGRDLYEALALPIGEDLAAAARLLECLVHEKDSNWEPLPPNETAVLETLFEQIHLHPDKGTCAIRHLTVEVNANLARSAERFHLNARAVGAVLTTLGFRSRTRTNSGWVVWLDRAARKRIHELMSTYGMDAPSAHLPSPELTEPCEFCKGEDLPGPNTSPAGPLASELTTENDPPGHETSPDGEHSERSERINGKGPSEFSNKFFESEEDRDLRDEMLRYDPPDLETIERLEGRQAERNAGPGTSESHDAAPQGPSEDDLLELI